MLPPVVRVVAGLLECDEGVLIACRRQPPAWAGWWEFPGGKVEAGEADAVALVRELEEELGVQVEVGAAVVTALHDFWHADAVGSTDAASPAETKRRIAISVYRIVSFSGAAVAREHSALAWVAYQALPSYKLLPADLVVLQALEDQRA